MAQEIKEVTEMHSKQMDAEDVRKTTEIIDNLISFQESEQVKELETTVSACMVQIYNFLNSHGTHMSGAL